MLHRTMVKSSVVYIPYVYISALCVCVCVCVSLRCTYMYMCMFAVLKTYNNCDVYRHKNNVLQLE